jgi:hypothetical protein
MESFNVGLFSICLPKMPCHEQGCPNIFGPGTGPRAGPSSPGRFCAATAAARPAEADVCQNLQRQVESLNAEFEKQGFNAKIKEIVLEPTNK